MRIEVGTIPGSKVGKGPEQSGFVSTGLGSHSSRTNTLTELQLLLKTCDPASKLKDYKSAISDANALHKRTDATRKESFRRLREMYGLDRRLLIFRALRDVWDHDVEAQPLLAALCARGRDPIMRAAATLIIRAQPGDVVDANMISSFVEGHVGGQLNAMTLGNIGRHVASSWTQSGHLHGRTNKVRVAC